MDRASIHVATRGTECFSPHVVSDVVLRLTRKGLSVRLSNVSFSPVLSFDLLVGGEHRIRVAASPYEDAVPGERWFYASMGNAAVRFNALRTAKGAVVSVLHEGVEWPLPSLLSSTPWPQVWAKCGEGGDWSAEGFVSRATGGIPGTVGDVHYVSDGAFEDAICVLLSRKG